MDLRDQIVSEATLVEIEELSAQASPGPWATAWTGRRHDLVAGGGSIGEIYSQANVGAFNAHFVVAARETTTDLCAEVRRLRAVVTAQTAALDVAADAVKMLPGCAVDGCYGCGRNKVIADQINVARELGR